jgi:hypothetical protein
MELQLWKKIGLERRRMRRFGESEKMSYGGIQEDSAR